MTVWLAWLIPSVGFAQTYATPEAAAPDTTIYEPGTQPAIRLHRLTGPVQLDGVIDEPAWEGAPSLPLVQYAPTYQGGVLEKTIIQVAYDDDHIYVAGHLYHEDIGNLRANSLYRDRWSGDETFALVLDTFNDNENALWFYTMPLGVRADVAVSNDAGGGGYNDSWNAYWDVATTRTDEGWFAEMRIPFSTLGFQDDNGRVVMGMTAYRWIAYNQHRYMFPDIPPRWERGHYKPSVMQDVILEGVHSRRPIYITPYALGGVQQVSFLNPIENEYQLERDEDLEAGLDVKYNVTNNLTLDLTVNTDFAQVEADAQQINLTRFSLFFPEKRQFFQERAGLFEFNTGMNGSRLFHSRRIGLVNGLPIRIWGGARLTGRAGDWDLGFLNMMTAEAGPIPAENFGVLRLRRRVFNEFSTAGGILTTRLGVDGTYDVGYGFDSIVRVFGQDYLTLKWAQSISDSQPNDLDPLDRARVMFQWERRDIDGISYDVEVTRTGREYDPGVGFVRRFDVTYVSPDINYSRFPGAGSPFRRIWVGNWANAYVRNPDNTVESAWLHPFFWFDLKTGYEGLISTDHIYEDVREEFFLSDSVSVLPGSYWFHDVWLSADSPDGWLLRPSATVIAGSFYDGWNTRFDVAATWNLSKYLELRAEYELNLIRFPDRNQELTTHLPQLRIQAAANIHLSAAIFLQYNSLIDQVNVNARFRYHVREGHDLWLVYNEGLNTERTNIGGPRLPITDNRAVQVKYTVTFAG